MAKTKELKKSPFMGHEEEGEESSRQFWKRARLARAALPFQRVRALNMPGGLGFGGARAEKNTKLKQARDEAEREISSYKAELEDKYQTRLKQVIGPPTPVSSTSRSLSIHCSV